jgi:hypothetical protein
MVLLIVFDIGYVSVVRFEICYQSDRMPLDLLICYFNKNWTFWYFSYPVENGFTVCVLITRSSPYYPTKRFKEGGSAGSEYKKELARTVFKKKKKKKKNRNC